MRFLYNIKTSKTLRGQRQGRGRESQRERDIYLEREGELHSGERKQHGLILTVGLNQQHLQIS
jgi:hypothetical protein